MGGYIAGPQHLIDCIRQYGEGFIFTTALTPAVLAGCHAAVDVSTPIFVTFCQLFILIYLFSYLFENVCYLFSFI